MNSPIRARIPSCFVAALILASVSVSHGQGFYTVNKGQQFFQTSNSGPLIQPGSPFNFTADASAAATLSLPSGATQSMPALTTNKGNYEIFQSFATKAALDSAYPAGTYRITPTGLPALPFNLTDAYPDTTPAVTNGNWSGGALVVNPAQNTTINFSTFSTYATAGVAGHMEFKVSGFTDSVDIDTEILNVPGFGVPVQSTPFTSMVIPAGSLTGGHLYQAELDFDTVTSVDTTTAPGNTAVAIFSKRLEFYIFALAPGTSTPAPQLVTQPTNQTGPVGGRATFNWAVNFGANPGNNIAILWVFNGEVLNLDGTKYAFVNNSSPGLVINNLTTADAGVYYALAFSPGGIVITNRVILTVNAASGLPVFTQQPVSQQVASGSTVVFRAVAANATSMQWRKDGISISGATSGSFTINGATSADAGTYSVVAANANGTTASANATLTVVNSTDPGRLINLSIFANVTPADPLTLGVVVGGSGTTGNKPLLARAVGPALAAFGQSGLLPDPKLDMISGTTTIATNDDWGGGPSLVSVFAQVGAFPFPPTSKDSAIYSPNTAPGNYSLRITSAGTGAGTVGGELYDATPAGTFTATTPRLINVSVFKQINPGDLLSAGFVIGGSTSRTVLIRAIGPGLQGFGIANFLPDPQLTVFNGQTVIAQNDNWGGDAQLTAAGARVGAFAISNGQSRDAMVLLTLPPGNYSVQISAVPGSGGGIMLGEVYEVQ